MNNRFCAKVRPEVYCWIILLINAVICAAAYAGLTMWTAASPDLMGQFHVTPTMISLGSSLFMGGYALGNYVEAWVGIKRSYRAAGLLGLFLMTVGFWGLSCTPGFGWVLFFRFLQGWGVLWVVANNSVVAWFPERFRGMAAGVIGGSLFLGIGAGNLVGTLLRTIAGSWQNAFRLWAWILMFLSLIWGFLMKEPELKRSEKKRAQKQNQKLMNQKAVWICIAVMFLNTWHSSGLNTFAAQLLKDFGYSPEKIGLLIFCIGASGIVSTPAGGILSDCLIRGGMAPVKARTLTMSFPGFFLAAVMTFLYPVFVGKSDLLAILGSIAVGWGIPLTNSSIGTLPMDILGDEQAAERMFGITILVGIGLAGMFSPFFTQLAAEKFGNEVGLFVLGAAALTGVVCSLCLYKK